jgi:hypothetical protein
MASPAEIAQTLPETLPADFSEWDGGVPPATLPANSNGFEAAHGSGAAPKPPTHPAKPRVTVSPAVDRLGIAPSLAPATVYGDAEGLFQSFRSRGVDFGGLKRRIEAKSKNRMMLTVVTIGSILLLLILIPLIYPKLVPRAAMVKQSVVPQVPHAADATADNAVDDDDHGGSAPAAADDDHGGSASASSAVGNDEQSAGCTRADSAQHQDGGREGSATLFGLWRGRYGRPER